MTLPTTLFRPAEECLQRAFAKVESYIRKEPAKAAGTALAAGLILRALPARATARSLTAICGALLPPALLGLGLIKALELCMQHREQPPCAAHVPPAAKD